MEEVERLAREYVQDVLARRAAGDSHAEYHAQRPKVEAYRALLDAGLAPGAAVERFRALLASIGTEVRV